MTETNKRFELSQVLVGVANEMRAPPRLFSAEPIFQINTIPSRNLVC